MVAKNALLTVLTGLFALALFAGCDSRREQVAEERKELQNTVQQETKEVRDAQVNAVKDINEEKKEASKEIADEAKDVRDAQANATTSGTTTSAGTTDQPSVTLEECAKLAASKTVAPEMRAKYEACAKLKK